MIKITLQNITERETLHLKLMYQRKILLERMIVTKMMILWMRTSTLEKQRLQMLHMCSYQQDNLQYMISPNLVYCIVTEYDGKGSVRCAHFPMATLINYHIEELSDVPVCRHCGISFSFLMFKWYHVYKVLTYSNRYFFAMILQVAVKLIGLQNNRLEKISSYSNKPLLYDESFAKFIHSEGSCVEEKYSIGQL